jgi:hypothetical protein
MQQDIFNMMVEINKTTTESLKKLSEINMRAYEAAMNKQLEVANLMVDSGVGALELARDVRDANDVGDFLAKQADLTQKTVDKLMGVAQESVKLSADTRDELMKWMEEGVAEAAKMKSVATPAATTKKAA